jgi:nitrate/nitrite transporter NarK
MPVLVVGALIGWVIATFSVGIGQASNCFPTKD